MTATMVLASAGFTQRADNPIPSTPVIVVSGDVTIRVPPDEATVRLGISKQAPTAQVAQDQANTVATDILAGIAKTGIAAKDVKTSGLTLNPVYAPRGPNSNEGPRIVAYQATNVVSVHVIDLTKVGPVIDAGLRAGANEIQGVQFGLRDDLAAHQQALKQAVAEAQKKAETIAEGVHAQLGPPLEITENNASVVLRPQFAMAAARIAAEPAPTPISAGEVEVHANVTIRYRIASFGPRP